MKVCNFFAAAMLLFLIIFGNQNLLSNNCPANPSITIDNCPTARFSIVNNDVNVGVPVQFSNQSTGAVSYLWDFGDGTGSTATNPSHSYAATGNYQVKLYATMDGCTTEFIGTQDVIVQ